ncbi:MAG TPA: flavodoxin-dependent (E)-4-hydroxy-3-methylbut-2-enyl-diphosphate synthase [Planctomycetota bacterium]|nr:flavodoxin-dependent (E)-4-hydroxy-3-methylbut-2-enyl-diphosphate synthase [Planctomycetota bacterium]
MYVPRRKTREVRLGPLTIGGDHPIRVQSMCSTRTEDVGATTDQIRRLEDAGCEIVRVAVPTREAADALPAIKKACRVPLVADIHFNHRFALKAISAGVDKVRLNPGNVGGKDRVHEVVRAAKDAGVPIRIGVNSGSVERDLLEKHGYPTPDAMVESALRHVAMLEELDFRQIIVSIKSTDTASAVKANRLFAAKTDIPLHLGITEAGLPPYASIKSAVGLGPLLLDGLGDTIRISLSVDPVEEVKVAYDILKASGRRVTSPELIACPTCGRIEIDLEKLVKEIEAKLGGEKIPVKISVLGCAVNGPGEAREADIGVAGARGVGAIYRRGELVKKVKEADLVPALLEEIARFKAEAARTTPSP